MKLIIDSPDEMLEAAYRDLGFADNPNLVAADKPPSEDPNGWVERGEWLATAQKARETISLEGGGERNSGPEKIFFVDGNPVVVFAKHEGDDLAALRKMFNRIWCMARPRLLFLALPGELKVFDLADPPISPNEQSSFLHSDRVLKFAKGVRDIQQQLRKYSIEQIESGKLFEDKRFEKTGDRADEALIRDLRTLRAGLLDVSAGSSKNAFQHKHAHAIIGRSIFIRYLEDRRILLRRHFEEVATGRPDWLRILNQGYEKYAFEPEKERLYPKVLADKEFTYALFDWLATEFNGDMFPRDSVEQQAVTKEHLDLLRGFLLGDVGDQSKLFFYAYDFEVIPIELISSIYEEFYTTEFGPKADRGTHYTPSALVEFLLSRVLTPGRLKENPRILDPACGSGIFLVEAFQRIVRYRVSHHEGMPLTSDELRDILRNQIAGIEVNPEAVRVAAFSLYLALLHYQDPKDIRAHPKLPYLVYDQTANASQDERYNILLAENAFDLESLFHDPEIIARFGASSADVAVGNPPWGFPDKKDKKVVAAAKVALEWCKKRGLDVGDKELSQAFIHRAIDFLKDGGIAGLLVSSGVLFKMAKPNQCFRSQWLKTTRLEHVVNFVAVRNVFFRDAIAPFISAIFTKQTAQAVGPFEYWSAKRTAMTARLRAPVLSRADLRLLSQDDVCRWDAMWKIHWWGGHIDEALIRKLQLNEHLDQIKVAEKKLIQDSGQGYKDCPNQQSQIPSEILQGYKELWTEDLNMYGRPYLERPPRLRNKVHQLGNPALYNGIRLLIGRGIRSGGKKGRAGNIVRLAFEPFCFRNSINAFRIADGLEQEAKIVLAICWSSLTRYYLFLTAGSWGSWHDEIHLEDLCKLPIRLPDNPNVSCRIVSIMDELLDIDTFSGAFTGRISELEAALDEAIFDLYELTEAERDLVYDMCNTGLDLFYNHSQSKAAKPIDSIQSLSKHYGVIADLPSQRETRVTMAGYLFAFLKTWNRELEPDSEFRWQVVCPTTNSPIVMLVFSTQYKQNPLPPPEETRSKEWRQIFRDLDLDSIQHYGSRGIFTDSLMRSVSSTEIVIIKRNEQRLWTRSMAREDAEATMLQAMRQQQIVEDTPLGST